MSGLEFVLAIALFGAALMFVLGLCKCAPVDLGEEPVPWDDPDYEPEYLDWDWPIVCDRNQQREGAGRV